MLSTHILKDQYHYREFQVTFMMLKPNLRYRDYAAMGLKTKSLYGLP